MDLQSALLDSIEHAAYETGQTARGMFLKHSLSVLNFPVNGGPLQGYIQTIQAAGFISFSSVSSGSP